MKLSRRDFLRLSALGLGSALITSCGMDKALLTPDPTAVTVQSFSAVAPSLPMTPLLLGLLLLFLLSAGPVLYRRRRFRK